MKPKQGLFVKSAGDEHAQMGREFMRSPEEFARAHGLDPLHLDCPAVAHEAMSRAKALAQEIEGSGITPDAASMGKLRGIVSKHFGDDFAVALVPFGLKFREKAQVVGEITGSATGTVTFLDTDADVDG